QSIRLTGGFEYSFSYNLTSSPDPPRDGVLTQVVLPWGGRIQYAYGTTAGEYGFFSGATDPETGVPASNVTPLSPCPAEISIQPVIDGVKDFGDSSAAVISRTETDPITGLVSTTTYTRNQAVPYDSLGRRDECGVTRSVVALAPDGNGGQIATRHVFHAEVSDREGGGIEILRRYYADANAAGTP